MPRAARRIAPVRPAADEESLTGPALRTFFRIGEAWQLSAEEQRTLLGAPPRSTFFKWKTGAGSVPRDTLERISYVLGIYKNLQVLLPEPEIADAWVRNPNQAPLFHGRSALE